MKSFRFLFATLTVVHSLHCYMVPYNDNVNQAHAFLGYSIPPRDIVTRFYHLHRVDRSMRLFDLLLEKQLLNFHLPVIHKEEKTLLDELIFGHEGVISTVKQMEADQSYEPLIVLWIQLCSYKYVNDELVMREFCALLAYILHENVSVALSYQQAHIAQWKEIKKITSTLNTRPLEEILDLLDMLVEELPEFIDQYELSSSMHWSAWLRKYWLIFPIGCAAFLLKMYITNLKNHPHYRGYFGGAHNQ